jgi:hypothetical protein
VPPSVGRCRAGPAQPSAYGARPDGLRARSQGRLSGTGPPPAPRGHHTHRRRGWAGHRSRSADWRSRQAPIACQRRRPRRRTAPTGAGRAGTRGAVRHRHRPVRLPPAARLGSPSMTSPERYVQLPARRPGLSWSHRRTYRAVMMPRRRTVCTVR